MNYRTIKFFPTHITIGLLLAGYFLNSSQPACHSQTKETIQQKVYDGLKEYKRLSAQEMSKFRRLANKSTNEHTQESIALEGLAQKAYLLGHLEETEEKLASSLSLSESPQTRQFYVATLIEEKKYLEALPSCLDISLESHGYSSRLEIPAAVEYDSLSHLMLAYVLAQIGECKASAFAYNCARERVAIQMKLSIDRLPVERRDKEIASFPHYRFPLPPLSIDPDKADRKSLLEATRTLFLFAGKSSYFNIERLTPKMIDEAYEDNPNSSQVTFYKALRTSMTNENGLEQRLLAQRTCQPYYQKAADLAGAKTTLGKLALECLKHSKDVEIEILKTIEEQGG